MTPAGDYVYIFTNNYTRISHAVQIYNITIRVELQGGIATHIFF